jgi:hypothetical protein
MSHVAARQELRALIEALGFGRPIEEAAISAVET